MNQMRLLPTCLRPAIHSTLVALVVFSNVNADEPYQIGAAKGPYFLVDSRVVEDRWHVERFVVSPVRHDRNPLLVKEADWEGSGPHAGGSVIRDPESKRWLMWYSVFNFDAYTNRLPFSYNVCLADSDDGLTWTRPNLGLFDYRGSTDNNAIRLGTDKTQNVDVCLNPRPDRWPGKFLSIHNQKGGVFVSWSDDGRSFQRLFEKPAISYHSDTHNNFVYDEVRDLWFLYCRPRAWAGYHRRRVSLQTSRDLQHWTHERTILIPSESEIPEYYGMVVFRRADLFFGIIQIYNHDNGLMHGELCWSDDGVHWEFLPSHPPFISLGNQGSWDAGMAISMESPVDLADETRFYYGGFKLNHHTAENPCAIGLMVGQRDRMIGVRQNGSDPGLVMTRPVATAKSNLTVNAIINGKITAELRSDDNKPIPGFQFDDCQPITESGFAIPIEWKGGRLSDVPNEFARIVFRLEKSELFTFQTNP